MLMCIMVLFSCIVTFLWPPKVWPSVTTITKFMGWLFPLSAKWPQINHGGQPMSQEGQVKSWKEGLVLKLTGNPVSYQAMKRHVDSNCLGFKVPYPPIPNNVKLNNDCGKSLTSSHLLNCKKFNVKCISIHKHLCQNSATKRT